MTVWERTAEIFKKENEIPFWSILGPVSLLCTFALSAKSSIPLDLLFLALAGLFLTARWQKRGCIYALILLFVGSAIRHCFLSNHLWNLGLEASLGCAFVVSTLAFEQGIAFIQSLTAQIDASGEAVKNLEEELDKTQQESSAAQVALQEKAAALQKELDEAESEHSSVLILNEVLRRTSARHVEEKESLAEISIDQERRIALLQQNLETLQKEIARLRPEPLAVENRALQKELNAARIEKEQTHLINETLARLHAKESLKVREAQELIFQAQEEARKAKDDLSFAVGEVEMLNAHLERVASEREHVRSALEEAKEVQLQKNALQERLEAAETEIAALRQRPAVEEAREVQAQRNALQERLKAAENEIAALLLRPSLEEVQLQRNALQAKLKAAENEIADLLRRPPQIDTSEIERIQEEKQLLAKQLQEKMESLQSEKVHLVEQVHFLQEKMQSLSQIEPLFNQLKKQFEEKNQVLHQTRRQLFKTDTELQTLQMEKDQIQPLPSEMISDFDQELERLEEENQELLDLVSVLSGQSLPDASRRKKKVKKTSPPDEQFLF